MNSLFHGHLMNLSHFTFKVFDELFMNSGFELFMNIS